MLTGGLIISVVDTAVGLSSLRELEELTAWVVIGITGGLFAVEAMLIYLIWRRHNWARIAILVLVIGGMLLYVVWPPDFSVEPWGWTPTILATALEFGAIYALFTGESSRWYLKVQPA